MALESGVIVDAGPLIALFNPRDHYHAWAASWFERLSPPLHTCEAVLSETDHLLEKTGHNKGQLLAYLQRGILDVSLAIASEVPSLSRLKTAYVGVPISLADACLVRMSELFDAAKVWTTDDHFRIYRKHRRQVIPLIFPP